jgi:hypothetical protein
MGGCLPERASMPGDNITGSASLLQLSGATDMYTSFRMSTEWTWWWQRGSQGIISNGLLGQVKVWSTA